MIRKFNVSCSVVIQDQEENDLYDQLVEQILVNRLHEVYLPLIKTQLLKVAKNNEDRPFVKIDIKNIDVHLYETNGE